MAKVLVTGGFGFIGSHLVRHCLQNSHDVTVFSFQRREPAWPFDASAVRTVYLDLRDAGAVARALQSSSFDYVFNLAGYIDHMPFFKGGRQVLDQHFTALQNILENLDRTNLKGFVQIGSSDEYGSAHSPQREDVREQPIAPYSLGKVASTHLIQTLARTEGFPGSVARFFLVYGPGQDQRRFLPQIIRGCLRDEGFAASAGEQQRDFTYVSDIVEGLWACALNPLAHGEVFNLASGTPRTIRSVVESIVRACRGGKPEFGKIPYRSGENMSLVADVSLAQRTLKWHATTSLDAGIERTIEFYRQHALH